MRRALLAAAIVALTACSGPHRPTYDGDKTLTVPAPDLVAKKKHSDIPDCPKTASGAVTGGMPSITVPCLGGGRPVDMAGLRGPMIVNFWASWCGSCREEMPALAAYAKSQSAVKVLGIDYLDTQPGAALDLAKRSRVAYPLVADPRGALDRASPLPHVTAMPMTVFLKADGTIARIEYHAYTSEADVAAAAKNYLGVAG
ncbi:TlpA disulfide reductase family protein [Nocardioides cynanchi]|uniref:TlpA disulfide reductase family protein n=1 Tax=Nocardioides cynanchi TaxID=2558918 RepID=UPI0012465845|nr:TlpA disulfide reductase family protein [Nocardioides cynanchi]